MPPHNYLRTLMAFSVIIPLAACQTTSSDDSMEDTDNGTSMVSGYEGFRPGPEGGVKSIWMHPDIENITDLSKYSKIIIDPITVAFKDPSAASSFDPNELAALTREFHKQLVYAALKGHRVTDTPGPDVMRLSIAITGIETTSAVSSTLSTFLPIGFAVSMVSNAVTGHHTGVGSASIEGVISDSVDNTSLVAFVDEQYGEKDMASISDPLDDAKEAFKWWAERLRLTLNKIHGIE